MSAEWATPPLLKTHCRMSVTVQCVTCSASFESSGVVDNERLRGSVPTFMGKEVVARGIDTALRAARSAHLSGSPGCNGKWLEEVDLQ